MLGSVLKGGGAALEPAVLTVVPALCRAIDSNNPSARQAASEALDTVQGSSDAAAWLPPLMAALGSATGGARGKALLLDRLVDCGPGLWQEHPALITKHALPPLFALLGAERRPELRQMAQGTLAVLAKTMGSAVATAAAGLEAAQRARVTAIVKAQQQGG